MPKHPSPPRQTPRDLVMVRLNAIDALQRETRLDTVETRLEQLASASR